MPDNSIDEIDVDLPCCADCGEFNLSCPKCVDLLPPLTDEERRSMSSCGEDFIPRLFLANEIAGVLVEKDLIPEEAAVCVASEICKYLNGRATVKAK